MTDAPNAAILLDRFLSASTADDVHTSLQGILDGLPAIQSDLLHEEDVLKALLQVLHTAEYKSLSVEDGPNLAARIYLQLFSTDPKGTASVLLTTPEPGRLLEALIDVAAFEEDSNDDAVVAPSSYTRVVCMQVLRQLATHSKLTQSQLLQATNGLHRLGQLISLQNTDLAVRQEALLLAQLLAKYASVAKVWVFLQMADTVMELALAEGGLTAGNVVVHDCCLLLKQLLSHDAASGDLVFGESNAVAAGFAQMLDLRNGAQFQNPDLIVVAAKTKKQRQQPPPLARKKKKAADVDDLDDLLQSSSGGGSSSTSSKTATKAADDDTTTSTAAPFPRLTSSEEAILFTVLEILQCVLEKDSVRQVFMGKHAALSSLVWELALMQPPGSTPQCALPSVNLQQMALQMTAEYLYDEQFMERHAALDRLLYLVCSGGLGVTQSQKLQLSTSALNVLRQFITAEKAHDMLVWSLAPEQEGMTPVQKLLNTLTEHLKQESSMVLEGAASGLSLFLTDEAARAMLLKLDPTLVQSILEFLTEHPDNVFVWRFLAQWMMGAPSVVHAVLQSSHSTILSTATEPYASLVLGLALEYLEDESLCGGWTRQGILETKNIGRWTAQLEQWKTAPVPWKECRLEFQVWKKEYEEAVLIVRKRLVKELTSSSAGGEGDEEKNPVQTLLAQQTGELEELRATVATQKHKIAQQEKELSSWKVRVESTPTQLDEMLTEYTTKTAELEEELSTVKEELEQTKQEHSTQTKTKDEAAEALRQQVAQLEQEKTDAQQECESLREEMTALSQAYSSLEEEYRRQGSAPSTSTSFEPPSQQAPGQPMAENGEAPPSTGSTEVATLRAENARLRADAKAADEWMAMAYEKMNDFGTQNASLQEQVTSLQGELQQIHQMRETSTAGLEEQVQQLTNDLSAATRHLQAERSSREVAEQKLLSVQAQVQSTIESLESVKSERDELSKRVDDLIKERDEIRQQVEQVQTQANDISGSVDTSVFETTMTSLRSELESTKTELQQVRDHEQEEIYRREARIRELESRLSQGLGGAYTVEDIQSRDAEIDQLREANESAQDWMSKAVEHHHALAEQVASLTKENSALNTQIKDLNNTLAPLKNAQETIAGLHASVKSRDVEVDRLLGELRKKEELLSESRKEIGAVNLELVNRDSNLQSLQLDLASAREELLTRCKELDSLRGEGTSGDDVEQLRIQVDTILSRETEQQKEVDSLRSELQSSKRHSEELQTALERSNNEVTGLQSKVAELTAQIESHGSAHESAGKVEELETMVKNLRDQLEEQENDSAEVLSEWEETYATLEARCRELEADLTKRAAAIFEAETAVAAKDAEIATLKGEAKVLAQEIQQYQTEADSHGSVAFEAKNKVITDLSVQVENLTKQLNYSEDEARSVMEQWKQSYADLEARLESTLKENQELKSSVSSSQEGLDRMSELANQIQKLKEQLNESEAKSKAALEQWQESRADLEVQVDVLKKENDELHAAQGHGTSGSTSANEDSQIATLKTEIECLNEKLRDQEAEASRVIQQWQSAYSDLQNQNRSTEKNMLELQTQLAESDSDAMIQDGNTQTTSLLNQQVQNLTEELRQSEEEASKIIGQWQESHSGLDAQVATLEKEKAGLQAELKANTVVHGGLSVDETLNNNDLVADLTAQVASLTEQLRDSEEEATRTICQWQESYAGLEAQVSALEKEKDDLQKNAAASSAVGTDDDSEQVDNQLVDLKTRVNSLTGQLRENEEAASKVIGQWQESHAGLEAQLATLENEKQVLQGELKAATTVSASASFSGVVEKDNLVADLKSQINCLTEQMHQSEEEASKIIGQWQDSYADLQAQVANLEKEREKLGGSAAMSSGEITAQEEEKDNQLADLKTQVASLTEQLCYNEEESAKAIGKWQESYAFLEAQVAALENKKSELQGDTRGDRADANQLIALENDQTECQANKVASGVANADELEEKDNQLADLKTQVESLTEQLRASEEEASKIIGQWQESHAGLESQVASFQEEKTLLRANATAVGGDDSTQLEKNQPAELKAQVDSLKEQLRASEKKAMTEIAQWQESYSGLEAQITTLEKEKEDLRVDVVRSGGNGSGQENEKDSQLSNLKVQLAIIEKEKDNVKAELEEKENQNAELTTQVQRLNEQLLETEEEAARAIEQWQEAHATLETQLATLEKQKQGYDSSGTPSGGEDTAQVEDTDSQLTGLRTQVESLTEQLRASEEEASKIIEQWQESHAGLEAQVAALEKEKTEIRSNAARSDGGGDSSIVNEKDDELADLKANFAILEKEKDELQVKAAALADTDALSEKEVQFAGLTTQVESLRKQLLDSEQDSAKAIEQWQESYADLEAQLSKLEEEKEDLLAKAAAESADKDNQLVDFGTRLERLTEQLQENEEGSSKAIDSWRSSCAGLEMQIAELKKERETWLTNQSFQTDDSSALKEKDIQIAELNSKIDKLKEREEEAKGVIEQWETSNARLGVQVAEFEKEKQAWLASQSSHANTLAALEEKDSQIAELKSKVQSLTDELQESEEDASNAIEQWQTSYGDLELQVERLRKENQVMLFSQKEVKFALAEREQALEKAELENKRLCNSAQKSLQLEEELVVVQDLKAQLENEREQLSAANAELSNQILKQEELNASQLESIASLKLNLSETREKLVNADAIIAAITSEKEDLQARCNRLEDKLSILEKDERSAVEKQKLLDELALMQEEVAQVRLDLKKKGDEITSLEGQLALLEGAVDKMAKDKADVQELLSEAQADKDERDNTILDLEKKMVELESSLKETKTENDRMQGEVEGTVAEWKARVDELESQVTTLEDELAAQEDEATDAISRWEARCLDLENQLDSSIRECNDDSTMLLNLLQTERSSIQHILGDLFRDFEVPGEVSRTELLGTESAEVLTSLLKGERDRLADNTKLAREKYSSLKDNVKCLQEKINEYGETIQSLTADIESTKSSSAVERSKTTTRIDQLERELKEVEEETARVKRASKDAEERAVGAERKLQETEDLFNSRLEASISEHARAKESVDSQRLLDREKIEMLETERNTLLNEKASLEQEKDELSLRIAELEDELKEADDAMQLYLTNEVSDKAAEVAAEALRSQIDEIRTQAEADKTDFLAERQARHVAEHEVKRLRADLATLLGMEDTDENHAEIQRLTVEAKGSLERKERIEIEALKTSLNQALEELASARSAEKNAEDRAAKASLQASMFEQDLVTAKNDFKILSETMDEMREAESSRRSSLEYRVSSLENDQNVLRRLHASEMEDLRNELNQIIMERDRLFQSLKESEKSKESLIQATARGHQSAEGSPSDLRKEVAILRMEKAQLLSAAAEEAARLERRLHERMAADTSSAEADLIVEKELRRAAERALENLRVEMTQLRAELGDRSDGVPDRRTPDDIEKHLNELKHQVKTLQEQKSALEEQLAESRDEAEHKLDQLSEECRAAKARALQIERVGRYDAEVRAEVSRLQTSHATFGSHQADVNPAEDSDEGIKEESQRVVEMYDTIQDLNRKLEEDRALFSELSAEHEDLLALLAQHDLLRGCMDAALCRLGGQDALDAVNREAEEKALSRYGKYVQL